MVEPSTDPDGRGVGPARLRAWWLVSGVVTVIVVGLAGILFGPADLGIGEVLTELADGLPFVDAGSGLGARQQAIIWEIRLPRVVLALLVGAMLATAGGAYQPGMSDYNIFIRERSKVFLAGPPLVRMATGEESDDETLGGGRMHAEQSGLADYLAEDEMDAIRMCREVVSHLDWQKAGPEPTLTADEPVHDTDDLLGLVSRDLRQPVDVRDVISRVVDGSRFEEFKPRYGPTMVCGWASVHGYPIGVLGNNGVIYPESAEKAAHFIQLCNR